MTDKIKAYKGFNADWTCRGFQYEIGKTYKHDGDVKACTSGFHACEHPLDVFGYYPPATSVFALVSLGGKTDLEKYGDTKIASANITVETELDLSSLIEAAIKHVFGAAKQLKKPTATGHQGAASTTGDQGAASATGHRGAASATGYQGAASATGHQGAASATGHQGAASATGHRGAASATGHRGAASARGRNSTAMACGPDGRVMGEAEGIKLFASEDVWNGEKFEARTVACGITGKKGIKPKTWYACKGGKLVKADR